MNKLKAGYALGERIKLGAVAHVAEEFFRFIRCEPEYADTALRRAHKTRDKIHQRGLAGAIRPHQAGDARRQRKVYTVHSKNFTIKLGDILENDFAVMHGIHERSTSRAFNLLCSSQKQMAQT